MEVTPKNNQVLLEATPMKMPGGLIANSANKTFAHLVVIAIGPGKLVDSGVRVPIDLNVGDRVLIHELAHKSGRVQALAKSVFDGRELLLCDAGDIIAVTTGEPSLPMPKIVRGALIPN